MRGKFARSDLDRFSPEAILRRSADNLLRIAGDYRNLLTFRRKANRGERTPCNMGGEHTSQCAGDIRDFHVGLIWHLHLPARIM